MNRRKTIISIASIISIDLMLVMIQPSSSIAQVNSSLLVSAAASLQDVLKEITPIYEKSHPGVNIKYNFAASGTLQQQIEQGAPVDLFISAGAKQMDSLQAKGSILNNSRSNLLTNRLVLIVPQGSSSGIVNVQSLTSKKVKRISIAEPRSVPVGQYSEEVFKKLGILEQLKPKFVLGSSVRNVLAAVESGNVEAGIVYFTDAKISKKVNIVELIPNNLHSSIIYPIAILKRSQNQQAAKDYLSFLTKPAIKTVFVRYGFGIGLWTRLKGISINSKLLRIATR